MELSPGTFVTDNLRLVELLGEGGMGCVWVAEHLTLRTKVAVKFIAAELIAQSPELVARFTREATAAAQIKSPHVVQTFDHGVMTDGSPYIVMELLEGEDLGQKLDREQTLPLAQVEVVISQVAKALNKAHAAGIIHRDIKPDNIFLVSHVDGMIRAYGLSFPIIHDRAFRLKGRFRVSELPATFVAEPSGKIRWVGGPAQSTAELADAVAWTLQNGK